MGWRAFCFLFVTALACVSIDGMSVGVPDSTPPLGAALRD
jgi:hypothetical protein